MPCTTCDSLVNMQQKDMSLQNWSAQLETHKSNTYRIIKLDCCFENYLLLLSFKERTNLSRFWCGYYQLLANVNFFLSHDIPRYCTLCNKEELGDAFHYLMRDLEWRAKSLGVMAGIAKDEGI